MNSRNRVVSWLVLLAVVLSMGLVPQASSASNAEGQFMFNDNTAQFTHAYAFAQKEEILVIVTNLPLSDEAVEDQWERSAMAREKGLKYVEITINSEQQHTSLNIRLDSMSRSIVGVGKLELTVFDENNVEGRFHSEGERIIFDNTYNFDFTFAAEIHRKAKVPPPTEAEKEAAAKSPQAALYQEYVKAVLAGDVETLKKILTSDVVEELDGEDGKDMLEFMQLFTPPTAEFQRITEEGTLATLMLSAQHEGENLEGTVEFVIEDDAWKVMMVSWETAPSESAEEPAAESPQEETPSASAESTEEPEAETAAESSEIDEELAALSPEEKYARTISDMRKLGTVFGSHQVDLNYFPICPSEKDVSEIEFGKSEWAAPSWDDYKDFYEGNFKDAWGTPFKYVSTDDGGEYTLTSYGADKAKGDGGGEFDADIVYSNGMFVTPVIEIEIEEPESEAEPKTPQEKFDRTVEDMQTLGKTFKAHLIDYDHYPICPSEKDLSEAGVDEVYYGDLIKDAWGTPFKYVSTDDGKGYTLTSYGADKAKGDGGGEFDADIVLSDETFVAPPGLAE